MVLTSGEQLGPYEIVEAIGAGGMGEVYKARDTRLNRIVAVKVLPPEVSDKPELRARFKQEAETIANLNHPHICTLYDVGRHEDVDYLVMEYIEGQTLDERLRRGALSLEEALKSAVEIADALDKAHRQGVVHRDLKPGNIMLTKSGIKLLDFGLAKLKREAAVSDISALATRDITGEGTILGTLQYMSPEQLEGEEADARSDVWSFGCVLYELVTAARPFQGKSQASLIASILSDEPPPPRTLNPDSPRPLEHLIRTCLAKDPEQRWFSAHDLKLQLQALQKDLRDPAAETASVPARKSAWRYGLAVLSGVAALTLAVVAGFLYFASAPDSGDPIQFSIPAPPNATFQSAGLASMILTTPAVSHSGRQVAFVAFGSDGRQMLWVRSLQSVEARELPGTESASFPFWSPDDRYIAFFAQGKLKKVDIAGGSPQMLCDAREGQGGSWSSDGTIVFAPSSTGGLERISASGGTSTPVTTLYESGNEATHRWPHFLPDGKHFLFLARGPQPGNSALKVGSLDSGQVHDLLMADTQASYVPPGYIVYRRHSALVAARFDPGTLELAGDPVPLIDSIYTDSVTGLGAFSASDNVLAYRSGETGLSSQLTWFDRNGQPQGTVGEVGNYTVPWLSPDERKVAVRYSASGAEGVWLIDLARGHAFSRFTFSPADCCPVWAPDGSSVVYKTSRNQLYSKVSSGAVEEEMLVERENFVLPTDWSSDGRFILLEETNVQTGNDLLVLPLQGDRKPRVYLDSAFNEQQGRFSPDVRWVAYASDESGRPEVYVQGFPSPGGKFQISTSGGADPRWRRDGKELYYISADRKLMAVDVILQPSFQAGMPKALFDVRVSGLQDVRAHYAVTSDGRRFLVNTVTEDPTSSPIIVVVNWPSLLGID